MPAALAMVGSTSPPSLVNCQHRWYDPYSGRWISRDPAGLEGGENAYEFCDGNPLTKVDRNGLAPSVHFLYVLLDEAGNVMKWGISSEKNLATRYVKRDLARDNLKLEVVAWANSRTDILYQERLMVKRYPGKLNKERWAGSIAGAFGGVEEATKNIVGALDPTGLSWELFWATN
jgi:uncharacterized protein RhaS with RHS repeats